MCASASSSNKKFDFPLGSPIRLEPDNYSHNMWGGDWIPRFKNLPVPDLPVGESWEFSLHPRFPSRFRMDNGQTMNLSDLMQSRPSEILGHAPAASLFLLKLIDSKEDLSVQVHPSEEKARSLENDSGKSEAWFVLEADPTGDGGHVYIGFNPEKAAGFAKRAEFEESFISAIQQANSQGPSIDPAQRKKAERLVLPYLNKVRVKTGDVIRVNPGTIHAIGHGVRLFEIQETSDITYRLWDWNRPDAEKLKQKIMEFRPLHLDKAKHVLNYDPKFPSEYVTEAGSVLRDYSGREKTLFVEEQEKFQLSRIGVSSDIPADLSPNGRFLVLTVIEGELRLSVPDSQISAWGPLFRGHTVLVPAAVNTLRLESRGPSAAALISRGRTR